MVEKCTEPFPVSIIRQLMKSFGSLRAVRYSTTGKKKEVSLRTWMVQLAQQPGKRARGGDEGVHVRVHRDTVRSWGFPPGSRILEEICIFPPFTLDTSVGF